MARCRQEFQFASIIADWGTSRQYIVQDICFDSNPVKMCFDHQGEKICIADYFQRTYKKRISDPK